MWSRRKTTIILYLLFTALLVQAAKLEKVSVIDKDYLLVHFSDGQVTFVDDGKGSTAFTSNHLASNNKVEMFGAALDTHNIVQNINWIIKSTDDPNFGQKGVSPIDCYRKSKLNGMAQMEWNASTNDYKYLHSMEHAVYLKLPFSMVQGKTYSVEINLNTNTDLVHYTYTFDIYSSHSEAIHLNLVGFIDDNSIKAADLFLWMGDGGARDYSPFVGNKVYLYDVETKNATEVGLVKFWKKNATEAGKYDLTASDVWTADFSGFNTPGRYRLAIEGVGCSHDFKIQNTIYAEPFKVSTLGFFYMRIGQDSVGVVPVPRQPLYIPHKSPPNTKIYITSMHPYHSNWKTFSHGDVWDNPTDWARYVKEGEPQNYIATGGHSDALDWDRHLGHISIIYDLLLPYILTDGNLDDDNLGIAESGNGIPDIMDEARNEVDFWLALRHGRGYSHGLTNPDKNNIFYQAENTPMAAWANAANSAMLAYCFKLSGHAKLLETYHDSAVVAYQYAASLPNQQLETVQYIGVGSVRGMDLKMMAAAYLYNITGQTSYEDDVNALSTATSNTAVIANNKQNQLWACAAYLKTTKKVNYPDLQARMKASIVHEAKNLEANYVNIRPSRRATDNNEGYFKTVQNVQRTIVAHAVCDDANDKQFFYNAMILEADWGLGRNSANIIYMTTASTSLASIRSIENAYTSGRNDGSPGLHPGHTPYINTDDWATGMVMGRPGWMTSKCYPEYVHWPKAEGYFNTRYVWAHGEFTPQQTMRGKAALYGYLYGLNKKKD